MESDQRWMRVTLILAAAYNLLWGALVVFSPGAIFHWLGMDLPGMPEIWQCVGMMVGVFGVGYACAAMDPLRYWPVTLVGLLGKILGPAGFLNAAIHGRLPWRFGWINVTNDLIWWIPFAMILREAWRWFLAEPDRVHAPAWQRARNEAGEQLGEMSFEMPVLLVALRHTGCPFCRQALADLARVRTKIEFSGFRIVLAHMGTPGDGVEIAARYGLETLDRIADPNRLLYHALRLGRGSLGQILGPRVWWRTLMALCSGGHSVGWIKQDLFQMGGVFLLDRGRIVREFRFRDISDRPDFVAIAKGTPTMEPARVSSTN